MKKDNIILEKTFDFANDNCIQRSKRDPILVEVVAEKPIG